MITFSANIRSASATTDDAITTSSVGIPVTLDLSADFDGLAKTLCFKTPSAAVDIALVGDATESTVPPDVLINSGEWLHIGIYAADANGNIVIPTVWANAGVIQLGTLPSGVDPSEPTPSWVAQVQGIASDALENSETAISTANEAMERATAARDSAESYANDAKTAKEGAEAARDRAVQAETVAEGIADTVAEYVENAAQSAKNAADSEANALAYKNAAEQSAANAAQSETNADASAATAQESAQAAQSAQTAAAGSASTASTKAGEAAQSAAQAGDSASAASASATAAGNAQTAAEAAQSAAETAQSTAEQAADDAAEYADRLINVYPTDTASGSIATFADGADDVLVRSLAVNIAPVQDLHGYDAPWPAGGGKNKCVFWQIGYIDASGNRVAQPVNGMSQEVYVQSGESVVFSTTVAGAGRGLAVYSGSGLSGLLYRITGWTHSSPALYEIRYTATQDCYVVFWYNYNNSTVMSEDVFKTAKVQIEFAAQATTYSPYSNICPISGWDSVTVNRTGKNLGKFGTDNLSSNQRATIDYTDSGVTVTATYNYTRAGWLFSVKAGQQYTVSFKAVATPGAYRIYLGTEDNAITATSPGYLTFISLPQEETFYTRTFTATNSGVFFVGVYVVTTGFDRENPQTATISNFQLELGSTATEYEPYTGETYPVDLGQTVYGGTLDVASGTLTIDHALYTFDGTETTWVVNGSALDARTQVFPAAKLTSRSYLGLCSHVASLDDGRVDYTYLRTTQNPLRPQFRQIVEYWGVEQTSDAWNAYLAAQYAAGTPAQLCFELATPIEVQLTPAEVTTLLGLNNIWADAGDVEVTYRADVQLYINKKTAQTLTAAASMLSNVETDMTATRTYAVNDFLSVNGQLYRVTAAIANGATITPGTNVAETTVGAQITALLNA